MIKPEGIVYKKEILERIVSSGLEIFETQEIVLSQEQFEILYGHVKVIIPRAYDDMKTYLTTNQVVILRVSGEDASRRLLRLRGASNPIDSEPGTIRIDYAKDQDYKVLLKRGEFARNVFHAAEVEEAEKMLIYFFGGLK